MTTLSFELGFKTDEMRALDVPVEVRRPNLVLVKRARASETVEVAPGTYFVHLKMPAGQEAWSRVEVAEGQSAKVLLSPEPGEDEEAPKDQPEVQQYLAPRFVPPPLVTGSNAMTPVASVAGLAVGGGLGRVFTDSEAGTVFAALGGAALAGYLVPKLYESSRQFIKRATAEARLRAFKGNVLEGGYSADESWVTPSEKKGVVAEFKVKGANGGQIVQLLQSGAPPLNVVLPTWDDNECRLILTRRPAGDYALQVHLQHAEANLLLSYWEQGLWQRAAGVIDSAAISAEQLLYQKRQHPIAASVGAYALLRLGALDRLHDWSLNLMNWFPWLPDGVAIRGEHLARNGEYVEALRVFCELPARGLPYFSDGLSYAVDRLRLYLSHGESDFTAVDRARAASTLARLEPFAAVTDFHKPLLTYTGIDPGKPDAVPVGARLTQHGGVKLSL